MPAFADLKFAPFTVAGRINSGAFQKAKAIATKCDASDSATVIELLPTDYEKHIAKLAGEYGGPAYLHEAGVAIYSSTAGFIGDDTALIRWLDSCGIGGAAQALASNGKKANWDSIAEGEYQKLLCESDRTFAFIELAIESNGVIGRLVFELFPQLAPKTCDNFLTLSAAELGGYVGSAIHRVKAGGWLQGGDVISGNGDSGASASGSALPDESFHMKHAEYGILGMANSGMPHTATSQFYVTFAPCPSFDYKYVSFGKIVDGHRLLKFIEDLDVANDRPRANLFIHAAGKVLPGKGRASAMYEDEDAAAAKLQAMHKARTQRKENQERAQAAKRVQAAKRGHKARKDAQEQRAAAVKVQAITRGRSSRKVRNAAP